MHRKIFSILVFVYSLLSALSIPSNASPFTIDVSTVYVSAGFVGIRTLTPITVLDVNGDAQFGSGTTKSTFTSTGLLKLATSGIQWSDGSTSTTAASGGGGVASGGYAVWLTTNPSGASSTTIHGLDLSAYSYRLEFRIATSANTGLRIQCADDTGSNYEFGGFITNNVGSSSYGSRPLTYIAFAYDSTTRVAASNGTAGQIWITKDQSSANKAMFTWDGNYLNDSSQRERVIGSGEYNGSAAVTKCALYPNSGTLTGGMTVLRLAN